jgi:hypothetical protein
VDRLIAGQRDVIICDRCVELCAENFSGGSHWDNAARTWIEHAPLSPWPHQRQSHFGDDVTCAFCGKAEPVLQWLVGCRWPNTFICDECVGLYLAMMREQPASPTTKELRSKGGHWGRFRWPWQAPPLDEATSL